MSPIFVVWYKTDFINLTKEEITSLKAKIMKLPTMSMDIFDKTLETINEHYPFCIGIFSIYRTVK